MFQKAEKKTLFTLRIDGYPSAITDLTFPLLRYYADKIGADFHVIETRKFKGWPPVYEKLQIWSLAQELGNDWNVYIDADALVHPETIDFTQHLYKDTVAHNGADMAGVRWTYDRFFRRDGRNIGSCNWFTIASDWCVELWKPLDDMTFEEACRNIRPTMDEHNTIITAEHLIDDYTLSRNVAKYGLKFTTINALTKANNLELANFFWHQYTIGTAEKVRQMNEVLHGPKDWNEQKEGRPRPLGWNIPDKLLAPYRERRVFAVR